MNPIAYRYCIGIAGRCPDRGGAGATGTPTYNTAWNTGIRIGYRSSAQHEAPGAYRTVLTP